MEHKKNIPRLIEGGKYEDYRGKVFFVNDFLMDTTKRFYQITHENIDFVRAWQGHKIESKWLYCIRGGFEVKLIEIDNWESPSQNLEVHHFIIDQEKIQILYIPPGYVNGFRATKPNSSFIIFSDTNLEFSKADDIRFEKKYWAIW